MKIKTIIFDWRVLRTMLDVPEDAEMVSIEMPAVGKIHINVTSESFADTPEGCVIVRTPVDISRNKKVNEIICNVIEDLRRIIGDYKI